MVLTTANGKWTKEYSPWYLSLSMANGKLTMDYSLRYQPQSMANGKWMMYFCFKSWTKSDSALLGCNFRV